MSFALRMASPISPQGRFMTRLGNSRPASEDHLSRRPLQSMFPRSQFTGAAVAASLSTAVARPEERKRHADNCNAGANDIPAVGLLAVHDPGKEPCLFHSCHKNTTEMFGLLASRSTERRDFVQQNFNFFLTLDPDIEDATAGVTGRRETDGGSHQPQA